MYIEASGPQQRGDNAKLYSPPLKLFGNRCLEFYYYMSVASIGSLIVTINKTVVFSASGDNGDEWYKASINTSSIVGSHMVSIFTENTCINNGRLKTGFSEVSESGNERRWFLEAKAGIFAHLLNTLLFHRSSLHSQNSDRI